MSLRLFLTEVDMMSHLSSLLPRILGILNTNSHGHPRSMEGVPTPLPEQLLWSERVVALEREGSTE